MAKARHRMHAALHAASKRELRRYDLRLRLGPSLVRIAVTAIAALAHTCARTAACVGTSRLCSTVATPNHRRCLRYDNDSCRWCDAVTILAVFSLDSRVAAGIRLRYKRSLHSMWSRGGIGLRSYYCLAASTSRVHIRSVHAHSVSSPKGPRGMTLVRMHASGLAPQLHHPFP